MSLLEQPIIFFIGEIRSILKHLEDCPLQENEGAPLAKIIIEPSYRPALEGVKKGDNMIVLTWLHLAGRQALHTKPRNNPDAELTGIFATRSPDRPNPIGMHFVKIADINESGELLISNLEVIDGTPVIDIKPQL
jgi:tRNA-Thr(GGU) m(6)t(6)A37 methyltransferase TsaA